MALQCLCFGIILVSSAVNIGKSQGDEIHLLIILSISLFTVASPDHKNIDLIAFNTLVINKLVLDDFIANLSIRKKR